ncbi:DUF6114 domain-containing protein [Paractinoplanes toevensis]|uniref:Uncharacterized protein n=1 Tax=Paractinoplanes toevensis TaxID=571911 RepID=A0A919TG30_9ACTN|nr:DUF6114 domain-containing protein [Actinoplanes toevensis]GIM93341.1 hypothetical protein Ato02nite_051340 [Actinoplanes toevensis]
MATDNFWGKFRRWRRHRPFWGGLFLLLSAVELYLSANLTLNGIEVHLGPQGFLSYLIPLILLVSGILIWVTPAQRLFYGIIALLAALYSFLGLNLGGFFIGMLLGILGGALVIAWGPPRPKPGAELGDQPPTDEPSDHDEDEPVDAGDDIFGDRDREDIEQTQQIQIAGHDDRPPHDHEPVRPATQSFTAPAPAPRQGLARLGRNPKAMVLALVPVAVTATILVAGSTLPASAEECPEGLPSRSTAATTTTTTTAAATTAAAAKKKKTTAPAAPKTTTPAAATTTTAATGTDEAADDGTGNPIIDGIGDIVDGVSNLLGINGEESSTPSESPSPSESATTTAPATTAPTTAAPDPTATAPETTSAATTEPADDKTTKPASVLPSASGSEIPCLGARQYGLKAGADDIPNVAGEPGLMEVDSLTMYNSTYDGVVDMPQTDGKTFKALKFSMDKAVNKPFTLTMNEPNGSKTVITSKELITDGTVKFYTPEFKGNLFGLIPVTFTPESPPPLTLPILWFTDAKIKLAYVRCDTLTGDPLKVAG